MNKFYFFREIINLWNQFDQSPQDARGIGIQMTKLESTKNKPSGSTIFKFIDRMREQERVTNELNNVDEKIIKQQKETTNSIDDYFQKEYDTSSKDSSDNDCNFVENQETNDDNKRLEQSQVKNSSQLKQTTQPEFFKQVKSNSNKIGKVKMPDIHELDMKVLIELPEDIRNEILNEYAEKKKNENISHGNLEKPSEKVVLNNHDDDRLNAKQFQMEKDISFSQIDPDFLAALPNDMKNEVKNYCDLKKKQRNDSRDEKFVKNVTTKSWNIFENDKKISKNGKIKLGRGRGRPKKKPPIFSVKINKEIDTVTKKTDSDDSTEENEKLKKKSLDRTFHFDRSNGNTEHTEILSDLVNCLLDLPISQVKRQIMDWISNNDVINDVDFLSITTYLGTLPRKHRLPDLFVLLKCLRR